MQPVEIEAVELVDTIFDMMGADALSELAGGYGNDIDELVADMVAQAIMVKSDIPATNKAANLGLSHIGAAWEESMRRESMNYFLTSLFPPNLLEINWHHVEWGNIAQVYRMIFLLAARDHGKSVFWTQLFSMWRMYRYDARIPKYNHPFIYHFTHTTDFGELQLMYMKNYINEIPELKARLFNISPRLWKKGEIWTANGCHWKTEGFWSASRGPHPETIIVDDPFKEDVAFSPTKRLKANKIFFDTIVPMLTNNGQFVWVGCVTRDTLVLTGGGLREIGSLCPSHDTETRAVYPMSDIVAGLNGNMPITQYFVNGLTATKRIELERGYRIEGSHRHPVMTMNRNGFMEWKRLDALEVGDYVAIRPGCGFGDASSVISIDAGMRFGGVVGYDMAYIMGLWIADGSMEKCGRLSIATTDQQTIEYLLSGPIGLKFIKAKDGAHVRCSSSELRDVFISLGGELTTAESKSIPSEILASDRSTVVAFLRGLFDGDGSISSIVGGYQVTYATVSERLARQVHVALLHLNIISTLYQRPRVAITKRATGRHRLYIVRITGAEVDQFMREVGFGLDRKNAVYGADSTDHVMRREIPNQSGNLLGVYGEKPRAKRSKTSNRPKFNKSGMASASKCSRAALSQVLSWCEGHGASGPYTERLKENLNNDLAWVKVKSISDGEEYTVDFVIPNDHTFISNGIVSHNTPFHEEDTYGTVRNTPEKLEMFAYFEYPAIFPDGSLLWEGRHSRKQLMDKKKAQGSLSFSREYLCRAVSSSSSIFPFDILKGSILGMEKYSLVPNREAFPIKFKYIVAGCDNAKSANIGSDYSFYTVWGITEAEEMWLINAWVNKGASFNEQISRIKSMNIAFRPDAFVVESNNFQSIYEEQLRGTSVPVIPHTTGNEKKDFHDGVPGMAILFERNKIRLPYGDDKSREVADRIMSEFNSITITAKGKLESVSGHDDGAMSTWFGKIGMVYMLTGGGFRYDFL